MNPDSADHNTIKIVVITVCVLAAVCVCAEAACSVFKIPDMSGALSSGFTHVTDTLVGALIALLINTRSSNKVDVTNTPEHPVPVAPANP